MAAQKILKKSWFTLLAAGFIIPALFLLFSWGKTWQDNSLRKNVGYQFAQTHVKKSASELRKEVRASIKSVEFLTIQFENIPPRSYESFGILKSQLKMLPNAFGMAVAYAPPANYPNDLFAAVIERNKIGKYNMSQIVDYYNFTDKKLAEAKWYTMVVDSSKPYWSEPHMDPAAGTMITQYSVPLFEVDTLGDTLGVTGVVQVKYSSEALGKHLEKQDLGEQGSSFILSKEGNLVAHHDQRFLGNGVLDMTEYYNHNVLEDYVSRALQGETFVADIIDPETGSEAWIFFSQIEENGWVLANIVQKNIFQSQSSLRIRNGMQVGLALLVLVIAVMCFRYSVKKSSDQQLWNFSIAITGLFACLVIWTVYLVHTILPMQESQKLSMTNESKLNVTLKEIDQKLIKKRKPVPLRVPTGMIVKNIKIAGMNEIMLSGYVWQRYHSYAPTNIKQGFLLPGAMDPEGLLIEEVVRVNEGDYEVVGWFFRAKLRQKLNRKLYPLDKELVHIEIWPKTLDEGVLLVPDLKGYKFPTPMKRPGLASDLHMEGKEITHSFFSYHYDDYSSNFGNQHTAFQKEILPDLIYNIGVKRVILTPIMVYGITILVVAALMFAVMILKTDHPFNLLSFVAALFFVLVVSHVGMRNQLNSQTMVYLEAYYLALYFILLLASMGQIMTFLDSQIWLIQYRKGLVPKLLYWPILTGVIAVVTYVTFYPGTIPEDNLYENMQKLASFTTEVKDTGSINRDEFVHRDGRDTSWLVDLREESASADTTDDDSLSETDSSGLDSSGLDSAGLDSQELDSLGRDTLGRDSTVDSATSTASSPPKPTLASPPPDVPPQSEIKKEHVDYKETEFEREIRKRPKIKIPRHLLDKFKEKLKEDSAKAQN